MPIKTLHLTNSWHARSGGIATFYRALIEAANREGHLIRLIVPGESDWVEEVGEFARIYHVKGPRARFNSQYRVIYPAQFTGPASPVQKILATEQPDIVEICDKYTLNYLGALLRRGLLPWVKFRPILVGLSCERMDDNFRTYIGRVPLARAFCASYVKWLYFPFFDHHIANSEYTAEELRAASRGQMVLRNIWIRPMGVDLHYFSPRKKSREVRQQLQQKAGASEQSVLLVYAGRLVPEKNLSLLFDTFVHLRRSGKRDYRLLIAGDGIERRQWEEFSGAQAPGAAWFIGHLEKPEELANLLANCDAFVHPNPNEPFGIAPLEAMASGLPLVAPNRGGIMSYASPDNAWIAAPDGESFASAVEELITNREESNRRAENALGTASQFRWEKVAASFLELYGELHRASVTASGNLPLPAFSSTQATGLELVLSRGVSRSAERIFQFASTVFWRSEKPN